MTSVAPAAAEQPPIFHVEAERTPLQDAVTSEFGEALEDEDRPHKGSKYILMTKAETRREKDCGARGGRIASRGNELFNMPEARAKGATAPGTRS